MWLELVIGLVGLLSTGLTWYFKNKQLNPYKKQLDYQKVTHQSLLAKYAEVVRERNELRDENAELIKKLYEGYDIDDLISLANRMPGDNGKPN